MKSYFGYVRVSTVKQGDGVSLDAQKEAINQFAEREGLVISEWFEEKVTAAKKGRPLFTRMVRDLKDGKADGVVFHKIDRSARNLSDWAKIHELADVGIAIHIAAESLDFTSRGGRLTADIQAVIAADYVRNLREECLKGINGRLKQGLTPFSAPLGYLNNGKGKPKTLDPARAPLVKTAFELYATGEFSLHGLREEMTKRGLCSRNNKPLTKRGFETILNNPFYCGIIRISTTGTTYDGIHEKLISARLFADVQNVRAGRAGKKHTKHMHLYRGLFRCGLCQKSMIAELQKGTVYYRCQTKACATKCVREDTIEQAIAANLEQLLFSEEQAQWLADAFSVWQAKHETEQESSTIPMQLEQVNVRLERLTDALIDRLIDHGTYNQRREKLLFEKAQLEERKQAEAKQNHVTPARLRKFLELINNLAALYQNAKPDEKRQIVKSSFSNRLVVAKKLVLEPVSWLQEVQNICVFPQCGVQGPTSRTSPDMQILIKIMDDYEKAVKKTE